jgi:hypothetical protein
MRSGTLPWPRVRPLGLLLQTPAHRVTHVLQVTQSNWQLSERRPACRQGHGPAVEALFFCASDRAAAG